MSTIFDLLVFFLKQSLLVELTISTLSKLHKGLCRVNCLHYANSTLGYLSTSMYTLRELYYEKSIFYGYNTIDRAEYRKINITVVALPLNPLQMSPALLLLLLSVLLSPPLLLLLLSVLLHQQSLWLWLLLLLVLVVFINIQLQQF